MKKRLAGFEELVLLATASLGGEAYGVTVQQRLAAETGSAVALGAVYAVLDRLERKGYARWAASARASRNRPNPKGASSGTRGTLSRADSRTATRNREQDRGGARVGRAFGPRHGRLDLARLSPRHDSRGLRSSRPGDAAPRLARRFARRISADRRGRRIWLGVVGEPRRGEYRDRAGGSSHRAGRGDRLIGRRVARGTHDARGVSRLRSGCEKGGQALRPGRELVPGHELPRLRSAE